MLQCRNLFPNLISNLFFHSIHIQFDRRAGDTFEVMFDIFIIQLYILFKILF